ncbi:MAG: hypothetical protein FWE37_08135 [Spirochaetaceae bacterium]|nr:hypothetical protein [Spirochaetaceae bacterium]
MRILLFLLALSLAGPLAAQTRQLGNTTIEVNGAVTILRRHNDAGLVIYELHTATANGQRIFEAFDSTETGQLDTFYYFDSEGRLLRQEIDSTGNGQIDIIIYLSDGQFIDRIWRDENVHNNRATPQGLS